MFDVLTGQTPAVDDLGHQAADAAASLSPRVRVEPFLLRATRFLRSFTVAEALEVASRVQGYWHPTGFMVFRTDRSFADMPVRVHCWPRGLRRGADDHPPLHNHMWQMASKVLVGTYTEPVYGVEATPHGELAVYTVEYRSSEESTIVDSGRRVNALPLVNGVFQPGEIHHLAAGAFHATTIPASERVVTVMVTGRPEIPGCAIIGTPGYRPGRQVREPVTPGQFAQAVGDLLR